MTHDPRDTSSQRRGLLAKVHIAKKQLGLDEKTYQSILLNSFGVETARLLTLAQLENLVKMFGELGWIQQRGKHESKASHLLALRDRISQILVAAPHITRARLHGLCRSICGVEDPLWCKDPERLKGLIAALTKIGGKT